MKKNVASQVIGAQMVSASDGSAFTGSVTVYVTGDASTQAAGSVGSGACTHEGNGFHTYAPAQAETNYDHIAFTFIGTGAVPATVQIYPSFPQTGDSFARIGAPAGASISADIAVIDDFLDTEIAAIKAKTDNLPTDPADASVVAGLIAAVEAKVDIVDTNVDSILVDTAEIGVAGAGLTAVASAANLAVVAGYLDTEIAAIKAKTDNLPASPAATGDIPTATQNADALLNRDMSAVSDTNARSPLNAMRFIRNKWAISGTTLSVKKEDDSTDAWTATVTAAPGADPISGNDPA